MTVVHLRLPLVARQSRDAMMRYAKNLPSNATLDITTMNILGIPRITKVPISQISSTGDKMSSLVRDKAALKVENSKRPWWMGHTRGRFLIWSKENSLSKGKNSGIWEIVARKFKEPTSVGRARAKS